MLARHMPACPGWTVQDLVAHHAALVADFASGSTGELGDVNRLLDQNSNSAVARDRDALTARQVHEQRGRPMDAVLEEWCAATAEILPMLRGDVPFPDSVGPVGRVVAVNDIVVHEGDLHEALGLEPPVVVHATSLALAGYAFSLDYRIRRRALPALALEYDGKRRVVGEGDPAADVKADRTTLVRVMASRLTDAQILQLAWRGDPTPYLDIIPEYGRARPS
ncbi:MAG: maleylpyruvate isomerase family mycothiol-dependent enzyme [Mycobacteriales bacterium]